MGVFKVKACLHVRLHATNWRWGNIDGLFLRLDIKEGGMYCQQAFYQFVLGLLVVHLCFGITMGSHARPNGVLSCRLKKNNAPKYPPAPPRPLCEIVTQNESIVPLQRKLCLRLKLKHHPLSILNPQSLNIDIKPSHIIIRSSSITF